MELHSLLFLPPQNRRKKGFLASIYKIKIVPFHLHDGNQQMFGSLQIQLKLNLFFQTTSKKAPLFQEKVKEAKSFVPGNMK